MTDTKYEPLIDPMIDLQVKDDKLLRKAIKKELKNDKKMKKLEKFKIKKKNEELQNQSIKSNKILKEKIFDPKKKLGLPKINHQKIDAECQIFWKNICTNIKKDNHNVPVFNMILPPPNITGTLHLGHALNITIQDVITRYKKLKGFCVNWIPGVDHAGIATQIVVEKQLMKEHSLNRHDIGREKFLERIWEWKNNNNETINKQIQTLCPMIDYPLEQFTMNNSLSKEVTEKFIELYKKNLIYRDLKMVDYCCTLKTVISNIEVEDMKITDPQKYTTTDGIDIMLGYMYDIPYEIDHTSLTEEQKIIISDKKINDIIISTTRPETLFGDVAVAVNPKDHRYLGLENILLKLPLTSRLIPLIYDEMVDINMGTGAVKITPSHDPNDFECYLRCEKIYNLCKPIEVIDDDGKMNIKESVYHGTNRYTCRNSILVELKEIIKIRNHETTVRICSRSQDILEYKLKQQWYINTQIMSQRAIDAVDQNLIKIIPDHDGQHKATWKSFLKDSKPWCISRQLWWGHRIPAYKIIPLSQKESLSKLEQWFVGHSLEEVKEKMDAQYGIYGIDFVLEQDNDVLDTWFSSAIYPFSILNGKYFPLDVLETGKDIIFFWVARICMLSLTLTNTIPFHTIYLHNLIKDKDGKKMSKSRGNIIDPRDIIYGISNENMKKRICTSNLNTQEIITSLDKINQNFPSGINEHGVDALRMGFCYYLRQGSDINLDINVFKNSHNLTNKIWNILNMYLFYLNVPSNYDNINDDLKKPIDQSQSIIIKKIQTYIDVLATEYLDYNFYEKYEFGIIYENLQNYILNDYCPFYLEAIKMILVNNNLDHAELRLSVLNHFKNSLLRLLIFLHPIAPNITYVMIKTLTGELVYDMTSLSSIMSYKVNNKDLKKQIDFLRLKLNEINRFKFINNNIKNFQDNAEKLGEHLPFMIESTELISFITKTNYLII